MDKICIVSTMRAPVEQTLYFVNYHLNIGIDKLFIFFDDPNDSAISHLMKYKQVECIRCDNSYWEKYNGAKDFSHVERQLINVNNALEIARRDNFQWIIHIDSDELIFPIDELRWTLQNFDGDEIRFTVNEAVPEKTTYHNIFLPRFFKKPINKLQKAIGKLICRKAFFGGEYFKGHMISKAATRISDNIFKMEIHHANFKYQNCKIETTPRILLLHFDCIGVEDWKNKWLSKARVSSPNKLKRLKKNRMRQLNIFIEAQKGGNEEMVRQYQEIYCIPKYERSILKLLRMGHTIKINQNLFKHRIETSATDP